ncbi:unnamed protein product [Trifolium pratense]|uniref:Uncharacterized protein n=1 Tax=Trifolium pratense TaxID=57577 RepID=A0ACB0JQ57_TRIPR|nr:unnamed protein product [Trifolium pratense]
MGTSMGSTTETGIETGNKGQAAALNTENDLNSSANVNSAVDASTKVNSDCIDEYINKTVLETNGVPDVYTFVAPDTGVGKNDQDKPNQIDTTEQERIPVVVRTDNNSDNNVVGYSKSDECIRSLFADKEPSFDKSVGDNPDVVIVNDIVAGDKSLDKTPCANVAGRIRSRAGKNVKKKSLKRKEPPSSDSDFERETSVATSSGTSRRSVEGKKVSVSVPYAPLDNISFHLENGSTTWKYVYHRRLALERNLKGDVLKCKNVVDVLTHAGLMRKMTDLGDCFDMLVREFVVNVADNCDDLKNPEYMEVFVRGRCVHFSPSIINKFLGRSE